MKTVMLGALRREIFGSSKTLETSKHVAQALKENKALKIEGKKVTYNEKNIDKIKAEVIRSFKTSPLKGKTRRNGSALLDLQKEIIKRF